MGALPLLALHAAGLSFAMWAMAVQRPGLTCRPITLERLLVLRQQHPDATLVAGHIEVSNPQHTALMLEVLGVRLTLHPVCRSAYPASTSSPRLPSSCLFHMCPSCRHWR